VSGCCCRPCEEGSDDPPSLALRAMARLESAEASLRVGGSNPVLVFIFWIVSLADADRRGETGCSLRRPDCRQKTFNLSLQAFGLISECVG
jgi:hypothetical protein